MEKEKNKGMIYEIKSKYILKDIFNYIPDTYLKLRLFAYSKYFHNKLELNYLYYYKRYLEKIDFAFNKCLFQSEEEYVKGKLKKEFDTFISNNKLNIENFEKNTLEYINSQAGKLKQKYISIDSPIFEILSKEKGFIITLTIYISQKQIDIFKLKNDYILAFKKLNNKNIKYISIYYVFDKIEKINLLEELNVNFNGIKNFYLKYTGKEVIYKELFSTDN